MRDVLPFTTALMPSSAAAAGSDRSHLSAPDTDQHGYLGPQAAANSTKVSSQWRALNQNIDGRIGSAEVSALEIGASRPAAATDHHPAQGQDTATPAR